MNAKKTAYPIEQLYDNAFVARFLRKKIPNLTQKLDLSRLTITPIKRYVGEGFYHIVVRYDTVPLSGKPIFCTAHSSENRENAFRALSYLWERMPQRAGVELPEPLFFDRTFRAFFYRGIDGKNLLSHIRTKSENIEPYVKRAARLAAALHKIEATEVENFNPENSRIRTTIPGPDYFLEKIGKRFPQYQNVVRERFERLAATEEQSMRSLKQPCLIHGDFHPENIIVSADHRNISLIDFTDVSLSDWARDLGTFLQQFSHMCRGHRSREETDRLHNAFLDAYYAERGLQRAKGSEARIRLYQSWAALRSAIYFLTKDVPEPENAGTALSDCAALL